MTSTFYPDNPLVLAAESDVQFPKAEGFGALIGDRWVRLAPSPQDGNLEMVTRDVLAERQDDTGNVYEKVLDIGYPWARADLSGGEGLDWFPRVLSAIEANEQLDLLKFWDSSNIDVRRPSLGQAYTWSLSSDVETWLTQAGLVDQATSDQYVFVAYGTTVDAYPSWDVGSSFTVSTLTTIVKIEASPNGSVAALLTDGTVELYTPTSGVFTPVTGITTAKNVWFVKDRFVVSLNPAGASHELAEFTTALGATFDTSDGACLSLISSGPAIVGAFEDGTLRSYVAEQANASDPSSVNLVIRGRTPVAVGEAPFLLGSNAGILLILTRSTAATSTNTIRLYQAEVLDVRFDFVVGQQNLRREWLETSETIDIRQNMAGTRDELWFQIQETPTEDSTWRYDLVTSGLSRHIVDTSTATHSIVVFEDRFAFQSGTDVRLTSDTQYQDNGYVISPNINFALNTDIAWLELGLLTVSSSLISGGKQVEMYYSTNPEAIADPDHPSWVLAIRVSSPSSDEIVETLVGVKSKSIALQLKVFNSQGGLGTPRIQRFSTRGIPTQRDWIVNVPVNVSDKISAPGRAPYRLPSYGDQMLRDLFTKVGENIDLYVLDPPQAFRGVINNIADPTPYITDRGSVGTRCVVQFRGALLDESSSLVTGDAGMGLGIMGVTTMGIGQTERT